jgi:hypothetical protein
MVMHVITVAVCLVNLDTSECHSFVISTSALQSRSPGFKAWPGGQLC